MNDRDHIKTRRYVGEQLPPYSANLTFDSIAYNGTLANFAADGNTDPRGRDRRLALRNSRTIRTAIVYAKAQKRATHSPTTLVDGIKIIAMAQSVMTR
jgi:hypothetical protein